MNGGYMMSPQKQTSGIDRSSQKTQIHDKSLLLYFHIFFVLKYKVSQTETQLRIKFIVTIKKTNYNA